MTRRTTLAIVLLAGIGLQARPAVHTSETTRTVEIQSFTVKGSIDFADRRQPRKGVFQVWYEAPDKYVRRERVTYAQVNGYGAGQPADITNSTVGFDGDFVIFDGTWPGPPEFGGRNSPNVPGVPTQADLSVLLPAVRADCADWLLAFRGSTPDAEPLGPALYEQVKTWAHVRRPDLTPGLSSLSGAFTFPKTFSDYRRVGSVEVPYLAERRLSRQGPATETWQTDEFKLNVKIDPKVFRHK